MAPFLERETVSLALVRHVDGLKELHPHAVPLAVLVLSFVLVFVSLVRHKLEKVDGPLDDIESIQCALTPSHKKRKTRKQRKKTQKCIARATARICKDAVPDADFMPTGFPREFSQGTHCAHDLEDLHIPTIPVVANASPKAAKCLLEATEDTRDDQDLEATQLGAALVPKFEAHHPSKALELLVEESSIEEDAAHVKLPEMVEELENPNGCTGVPEAACIQSDPWRNHKRTSEASQLKKAQVPMVETHHPAEESRFKEDAAHVKLPEMLEELENPICCAGVPKATCIQSDPRRRSKCTSQASHLGTAPAPIVESHLPGKALEPLAEASSIGEGTSHAKLPKMFQESGNPSGCAGVPEAACVQSGPCRNCKCASECSWGCPYHQVYSLPLMLMHRTMHKRITLGAPGLEIDRSSASWHAWQRRISFKLLNRNSCELVRSSRR